MAAKRPSCYEKAVKLLALRPHFVAELERKLQKRGYDDAEVASAVARLGSAGLLDDRKLAHAFVAQRLARAPEGRRKLAMELRRRGVASDIATEALDAALPEDDEPLARAAAARWPGRGRKGPAALARHLERRGFSSRAIVAVLRDLPDAGPTLEAYD